jgi:hypothetical protein
MLFFKKNLLLKLALFCLAVPLFLFIQGCLESENKLTLKKDGSGQLEVMYILKEDVSATPEQPQNSGSDALAQPVSTGLIANEKDLREQFQGEGIKIEKAVFEKENEKLHVSYTVTFTAVKNLLDTRALQKGKVSFYRDKNNNLGFQIEIDRIRNGFERKKNRGALFNQFYVDSPRKNPGKQRRSDSGKHSFLVIQCE